MRELARAFSTPEAVDFCQHQIARALCSEPHPRTDTDLGEGVVHRFGNELSTDLEVWPQSRQVVLRTNRDAIRMVEQTGPIDVTEGDFLSGRVVFVGESETHKTTLVVNADGGFAYVGTPKPINPEPLALEPVEGSERGLRLAEPRWVSEHPSSRPQSRGYAASGGTPSRSPEPTPVGRDSEETRPTEKDGRVRLTGTVGAEPNLHETSDGRPRIVFPLTDGKETRVVYATKQYAERIGALGLMPGEIVRVTGVNHEVRGESWTYAFGVARQGKEDDGAR